MINILIVDDSKTETLILKSLFQSAPDMRVVACAENGKQAVEMNALLKPDIITMDIKMPVMDGLEATRIIMAQDPTPIVIISSHLNNELKVAFNALQAGALSVLDKPDDIHSPMSDSTQRNIIDTVRSMSEINVIKRRFLIKKQPRNSTPIAKEIPQDSKFELVAIGTSVGGPQALIKVLTCLPANFPLPIVIVQHMTHGFISGFAKWLNHHVNLEVKIVEQNEILQGGTVYFAPDFKHFEVIRKHDQLTAKLVNGDLVDGFCPSATVLLSSVATTCGKHAIGALLTGMGSDGAQGLLQLKKAHAHTFIQDAESAVVFGMAGVAQSLGAADKVIELDKIGDYLTKITHT